MRRALVVLAAPRRARCTARDERDLVAPAGGVAPRGRRDHEASEDHLPGRRRGGDDALRSAARALDNTAAAKIEVDDLRRRVADVEAVDRPAADLAGEEERRVALLHRQRIFRVLDKD